MAMIKELSQMLSLTEIDVHACSCMEAAQQQQVALLL